MNQFLKFAWLPIVGIILTLLGYFFGVNVVCAIFALIWLSVIGALTAKGFGWFE